MSVTLTKVAGPTAVGAGLKIAQYTCAFDSSYPTGGEGLDLTGEFTYVYSILPGGNDTLADNGYLFQAVLPAPTTATSSTNTLMSIFWSADGTDGEVFVEFTNGGNPSAVGQLSLTVIGA